MHHQHGRKANGAVPKKAGIDKEEPVATYLTRPLENPSTYIDLTIRKCREKCTEEAVNKFSNNIEGVVVVYDACRGVEPRQNSIFDNT